jgi:hypothetical protein
LVGGDLGTTGKGKSASGVDVEKKKCKSPNTLVN